MYEALEPIHTTINEASDTESTSPPQRQYKYHPYSLEQLQQVIPPFDNSNELPFWQRPSHADPASIQSEQAAIARGFLYDFLQATQTANQDQQLPDVLQQTIEHEILQQFPSASLVIEDAAMDLLVAQIRVVIAYPDTDYKNNIIQKDWETIPPHLQKQLHANRPTYNPTPTDALVNDYDLLIQIREKLQVLRVPAAGQELKQSADHAAAPREPTASGAVEVNTVVVPAILEELNLRHSSPTGAITDNYLFHVAQRQSEGASKAEAHLAEYTGDFRFIIKKLAEPLWLHRKHPLFYQLEQKQIDQVVERANTLARIIKYSTGIQPQRGELFLLTYLAADQIYYESAFSQNSTLLDQYHAQTIEDNNTFILGPQYKALLQIAHLTAIAAPLQRKLYTKLVQPGVKEQIRLFFAGRDVWSLATLTSQALIHSHELDSARTGYDDFSPLAQPDINFVSRVIRVKPTTQQESHDFLRALLSPRRIPALYPAASQSGATALSQSAISEVMTSGSAAHALINRRNTQMLDIADQLMGKMPTRF